MSEPVHPRPHPDVAGYALGGLEPAEADAFERHLAGCADCQAELDDLRPLARVLAEPIDSLEALEPSADLRRRTLQRIQATPQEPVAPGRPAPTGDGGSGGSADSSPAPVPIDAGRRHRRPGLPAPRWLVAVAAAVVIAVGASVVAVQVGSKPAVAEILLVDPSGGPNHGSAKVRKTAAGRSVTLSVDLPPSPAGTLYECWFVGAGDTLEHPNRVAVGTFKIGPSGHLSMSMTSAADATRFPKMGITREPDDGNPQRRGDKVLTSQG